MGNCVFKGIITTSHGVLDAKMVKVVTSNGGIMELYTPITVDFITKEFPGHGIFQSRHDLFSKPLLHNEELHAGEVYYLLPLNPSCGLSSSNKSITRQLSTATATLTPYRMFTYDENNSKMWSEAEVFPRHNRRGVWKVKLVISPEQLSEILSQESMTEALIESLRTVAKCGNGSPSLANSGHLNVSSSRKGSMPEKLGLHI